MRVRSESGFSVGWLLAAVAAAAIGLGTAWMLAQAPRGMSQFDRLGAEIGCQCGTCPLRPIATCGCGFADGMLDELHELVDGDHSDDEIMATFVSRYNESIRIKPSSSGLDLIAWAAPMLLLTVGAVAVAAVVRRWAAGAADGAAAAEDGDTESAPAAETSALRERLERELQELD